MMTLLVLLVSSILDKCPDPEPRSRIVLNFLLMSYTRTFKQRVLNFEISGGRENVFWSGTEAIWR